MKLTCKDQGQLLAIVTKGAKSVPKKTLVPGSASVLLVQGLAPVALG